MSRLRLFFRTLFAAYLALLALSYGVRWLDPAEPPALHPHQAEVSVPRPEAPARSARVAYAAWGEPGEATPIVLLHGSPGSHADFHALGPELAAERWVLAPDLPGFGASERRVGDYSIRAHAGYVLELLDELGVERAHVLGFSMGGGVALELYRQAPERVASVVMMAAIGVQELELLGDYHLNHFVHGLQLGAIEGARWGLPHMGALDGAFLGREYARNFFDTDQRPLRGVLEGFEPPMLILHGVSDPLVPTAAAREHARLVPQSELLILETDHFFLFRGDVSTAAPIADFLSRVDRGTAAERGAAEPQRLAAAREPFDPGRIPSPSGFAATVTGLLLALSTLVSEDLTTIGAGILVSRGRISFLAASTACFLGIFVGDLLLFLTGRGLGRAALVRRPFRWWISDEAVQSSSEWFKRRGPMVIVLSRFMPGARLPTYFAAGALKTSFWRFALYFAAAALVWTPALVALSMALGGSLDDRLGGARRQLLWLALGAVALLVLLRGVVLPLATYAGRRRLVGRWRRWTRWEFWPPWLFYPPVVLYVLWLGLRHRCLTLFTAANPGIPAGGFIGESKAEILSAAGSDGGEAEHFPRWRLVEPAVSPGARAEMALAFQAEAGLAFPLVLKPDAGQRGAGVAVTRSAEEVYAYFEAHGGPTIAQEHVAGEEFGVFYLRRPGEERGAIFSITEKKMPRVMGDGVRSLERLVLDDPRAVAIADLYLEQLGARRWDVPAAGEPVRLVELGTHCRGAVFLDGAELASDTLRRTLDRLSRRFEGFYFGRYDLRAPSREALAAGGPFKVIEINGVTSEATHIYDPRHSVFDGWRTLARQWRLAFEIGAANRARGARVATVRELWRALREHRGTGGATVPRGSASSGERTRDGGDGIGRG